MTAYKIDELAHEANVSARTIRYYVQRGLLPAPEFRGKDTAYGRAHLLRLQAIKKLQEMHLPLDEIQARLLSASERDLERLVSEEARQASAPRGGPYRCPGQETFVPKIVSMSERWERIRLLPGLELHVRSDAGAEALRAAREIESKYGQGVFVDDEGKAR